MRCPLCDGSGDLWYPLMGQYVTCHRCNGKGVVSEIKTTCPICNVRDNTGKIPSGIGNTGPERCRYCYGTRTVIKK